MQEYQDAAAFVVKMAGKVVQWLDPQPSDKILDVGCGGVYASFCPQMKSSPSSCFFKIIIYHQSFDSHKA